MRVCSNFGKYLTAIVRGKSNKSEAFDASSPKDDTQIATKESNSLNIQQQVVVIFPTDCNCINVKIKM